jgi:hypothetical protein
MLNQIRPKKKDLCDYKISWHVVSSIKITQNSNESDTPFGFEVNMFHVLCCNNVYEGKSKLNSKSSNYYDKL